MLGFIAIIQSVLFGAHWFVYRTWSEFRGGPDPSPNTGLWALLALLSVSFVTATLLAFRYSNFPARSFYTVAAVWAGFLNFFLLAACLCWTVYLGAWLLGMHPSRPSLAAAVFGLAALASVYGLINARLIRAKRIKVEIPNIPPSWRGRVAAVVSDVHLGHVNGHGFMRRIIRRLDRLRPDIVFITGDLFDGTKVNARHLATPWKQLSPAFGTYFVTGNHEEFADPTQYLNALSSAGVRVLTNEAVTIDGVDILGVRYGDSVKPERLRPILQRVRLDRGRPSILLAHAPHQLAVAESEGITLQLSGHTHAGQVFPFTWIVRRVFGRYAYGLNRFGRLAVYTSSGAGTWGPPMRVGARPEIALIEFG